MPRSRPLQGAVHSLAGGWGQQKHRVPRVGGRGGLGPAGISGRWVGCLARGEAGGGGERAGGGEGRGLGRGVAPAQLEDCVGAAAAVACGGDEGLAVGYRSLRLGNGHGRGTEAVSAREKFSKTLSRHSIGIGSSPTDNCVNLGQQHTRGCADVVCACVSSQGGFVLWCVDVTRASWRETARGGWRRGRCTALVPWAASRPHAAQR